MEPNRKTSPSPTQTQEDVDLGHLFSQTGGALNSIFAGIGNFFRAIGQGILLLLFFFRRNLGWLLLGILLGACYGFYLLKTDGAKYTADLVVRANFNSTRSLYGAIDYFSALISSSRTDELAKVLKISPDEASRLTGIEAAPVKSELMTAELYNNYFLASNPRTTKPRTDTFWIRTIEYKDFKSALTKFDYPLHEISVTSTDPLLFSKIQQGIIERISSIDFLQAIRTSGASANKQTVDLLTSSIQGLDTLRRAYNKRLSQPPAGSESGGSSNITLLDGAVQSRVPELELYDKMLDLKDELKAAKTESVVESDVIQVYSPFPSVGQRENFFRQSVIKYSITGFILALAILALIAIYRWLTHLENVQRQRKAERLAS